MMGAGLPFRRLRPRTPAKLHTRVFQPLPWERQEGCQRMGFEGLGGKDLGVVDESYFESNR